MRGSSEVMYEYFQIILGHYKPRPVPQHGPGRLETLFYACRSFWEGMEATTHPQVHLSLHPQRCSQMGLRGGPHSLLAGHHKLPQALRHPSRRPGTLCYASRNFWGGMEASMYLRVHLSLYPQRCSQTGLRGGHDVSTHLLRDCGRTRSPKHQKTTATDSSRPPASIATALVQYEQQLTTKSEKGMKWG